MESCNYKVCGRDSPSGRNLNRRDCPQGRSLVSVEKSADEISSTGGRRRISPRPYRLRVRIPCHRQTKIRITHKGFPDFCVEVAGFELHFGRNPSEGQFLKPNKINTSMIRHTQRYSKKSSQLRYGCGTFFNKKVRKERMFLSIFNHFSRGQIKNHNLLPYIIPATNPI